MPTGIYKHKPMNEKAKIKLSVFWKGKKKKPFTKEHIKNLSKSHIGKKYNISEEKLLERGRKISKIKMGHKVSEETKDKIRKNTIQQHIKGFPQTNTRIELKMKLFLDKIGIDYIHPYNFNDKFACDFAIPIKKLIIECDGDYWHNREDIKKRDKAKNAYIKKCGWTMLRYWEKDIKNNFEKIIQEVSCYLDKEEKEKCKWLLENNIFGKILIASKEKEGRKVIIKYKEFENEKTKSI